MKRLILLILVAIVGTFSLIGCQDEKEVSTIKEYSDMFDSTFKDVLNLYIVTSPILTTEGEELDKTIKEINEVIEKLDDESVHFFSEEAREVAGRMTSSAKNAIEYHKLFLESDYSSELHQSTMDEITKIADLMREYEKLYREFLKNR
ncbi:hypothetical protein [Tepidibacter hydrothermalis]|uniref:Lipoprotein n=1 Tax=Tepidibacter hydrothermalis TaxID=3036126 RepID=A0ABY8E796_9FIRM|nr:hypothetical protein [Tepidibacter hydrothermalis]WFD08771.1 hypothetical protein P4S50_10210 [Tepidibacter hydrothermalis]